jgi:hypothetical protein
MPLPEGYLPRKGDIVLVQARAKRDAYPNEPDIQCYFEIVGHETNKFFMAVSEIHSIYSRNWEIGDTVSYPAMFEGPAEVLAVDGHEVWVRDTENQRWTIEANELEAYVEPPAIDHHKMLVEVICGEVKAGDTIVGTESKIVDVLPQDEPAPLPGQIEHMDGSGPVLIQPIAAPPSVDAASIGSDDMPI